MLIASGSLCIMLSVIATTLFASVSASTPMLYVDPPNIMDPAIFPHDTIVVSIIVDSVSNMKRCEFNLTFNAEVLAVERIAILKLQGQYPQTHTNFESNMGYIWAQLIYENASTISEATQLMEVEFYVMDYGSTDLHFQSSILIDDNEQPIPHESKDGFVWILKRDILIQGISPSKYETYVGRMVFVNVTVSNDGDLLENFTVNLFYDSTLIATMNLSLSSKEEAIVPFVWNTSETSPRLEPYSLKAEASILPYEADTLNNVLLEGDVKIKIMGDVNGDGTVDINDLIEWDNAYGSHLGEPKWDDQADINNDEMIDELDAMLILEHYKETLLGQ